MTKENIINQREKLLYNKNGYTIDGWILWDANTSLEVVDQGLVTHSGGSIRQTPLVQKLEVNCLIPGIYTLSIFATKNVGFPNYFVEDIGDIPGHINADSGLVTFTFEVPDAVKDKTHWVSFEAQDDSLIKAAKLEPGPTQTLAHKDAAGNWVLNDPPPDYGLELLKCQRYLKKICFSELISARFGDTVMASLSLQSPMRETPTILNSEIFGIYDNSGNHIGGTINTAYTGANNGILAVGLHVPSGQNAMTYGITIRSGGDFVFVSSEL